MNKLALVVAAAATVATFGMAGAYAQQAGGDFTKADANKDGSVTFEEAVGVYSSLTQDQFNKADANADGKLDEAEFGTLAGLTAGDNGNQASSQMSSGSAPPPSSSGASSSTSP